MGPERQIHYGEDRLTDIEIITGVVEISPGRTVTRDQGV
jgi:hypothetical protein